MFFHFFFDVEKKSTISMNMNKFRLGIESHNVNNANEIEAKKTRFILK